MKSLIAAIAVASTCHAETLMFPVQDLLFEHPNFLPPKMSFNAAMQGSFEISEIPRMDRKTRREIERRLIDFMWDEHPDAESIRIWNGTLIVRIP